MANANKQLDTSHFAEIEVDYVKKKLTMKPVGEKEKKSTRWLCTFTTLTCNIITIPLLVLTLAFYTNATALLVLGPSLLLFAAYAYTYKRKGRKNEIIHDDLVGLIASIGAFQRKICAQPAVYNIRKIKDINLFLPLPGNYQFNYDTTGEFSDYLTNVSIKPAIIPYNGKYDKNGLNCGWYVQIKFSKIPKTGYLKIVAW